MTGLLTLSLWRIKRAKVSWLFDVEVFHLNSFSLFPFFQVCWCNSQWKFFDQTFRLVFLSLFHQSAQNDARGNDLGAAVHTDDVIIVINVGSTLPDRSGFPIVLPHLLFAIFFLLVLGGLHLLVRWPAVDVLLLLSWISTLFTNLSRHSVRAVVAVRPHHHHHRWLNLCRPSTTNGKNLPVSSTWC